MIANKLCFLIFIKLTINPMIQLYFIKSIIFMYSGIDEILIMHDNAHYQALDLNKVILFALVL